MDAERKDRDSQQFMLGSTFRPRAPLAGFRNYREKAPQGVVDFYRKNHRIQTLDFALAKKQEYISLSRKRMGVWQGMEFLNTLVDSSDPDTDLSQIQHLLQTAEAIRKDLPTTKKEAWDWLSFVGATHDLGKILCLYGEPQEAVAGDTFPVGCRFSDKIVFSEFFADNPDSQHSLYQTKYGIYSEQVGLDNVHMSWGHDEYLYQVLVGNQTTLPEQGLYIILHHSFYSWHNEGEYWYLIDAKDRQMLPWVQLFQPYDLYSKGEEPVDIEAVKPYYEKLFAKYCPPILRW